MKILRVERETFTPEAITRYKKAWRVGLTLVLRIYSHLEDSRKLWHALELLGKDLHLLRLLLQLLLPGLGGGLGRPRPSVT